MMTTKKPITGQLQTWINYLSSLDIDLQFRKGVLHTNADMLSRRMCETCAQCMTSHEDAKKEKPKTRLLASMATPDDEDKEMEEIRKDIENQRTDKFFMKNGEIYTTMGKKWITARKRMAIIKEIHQGLCHAGGEKTWQHMRETHDMKDMKRMIQETINNQNSDAENKRRSDTY